MAEAQKLAFYLTAHFSQEDYPYEWQVQLISYRTCAHVFTLKGDALAFQGGFHPGAEADMVTGLPPPKSAA